MQLKHCLIYLFALFNPVIFMAKKQPQGIPKLEHVRDPGYREVYATGALGGFDSQGGFHMIFYSPNRKLESLSNPKEQVVEVSHKVKVIVTPQTLKHLMSWLEKSMSDYEEKFGKVQEPVMPPSGPSTTPRIIGAHPPETMYG